MKTNKISREQYEELQRLQTIKDLSEKISRDLTILTTMLFEEETTYLETVKELNKLKEATSWKITKMLD